MTTMPAADKAPALRRGSRQALALAPALAPELARLGTPDGRRFLAWTGLYLAGWALGVLAVALVAAQAVAPADHAGPLLLLSALLGSQLHALTVLQHDCGHRSAFASAAANLWVGRCLAWFVFMPFTTFSELHRRHHGFLGDPGHDPDEWFYEAGPRWLFLRECLFMPRFIVLSLTRLPAGEPRRRVRAELLFNSLTHAALLVTLLALGAERLLVFGYALPMLWLALVFNPVSRGYEHYPLAGMAAADPRRDDLRRNTITVTSPLIGALWAHISLHVEHHLHPRVPFYRLPQLHRLMAGKTYRVAPFPLCRSRDRADPAEDLR